MTKMLFCRTEATCICVSPLIDFITAADCGAAFMFLEFQFSCMEDHTTYLVNIYR